MNRISNILVTIVTALVIACGVDSGSGAVDDRTEREAVAREVGRSVTGVGGAAATLAAPLARALDGTTDGQLVAAADGPLRTKIEAAVATKTIWKNQSEDDE